MKKTNEELQTQILDDIYDEIIENYQSEYFLDKITRNKFYNFINLSLRHKNYNQMYKFPLHTPTVKKPIQFPIEQNFTKNRNSSPSSHIYIKDNLYKDIYNIKNKEEKNKIYQKINEKGSEMQEKKWQYILDELDHKMFCVLDLFESKMEQYQILADYLDNYNSYKLVDFITNNTSLELPINVTVSFSDLEDEDDYY